MNDFIRPILEWFKRTFGIRYEEKQESELLSDYDDIDEISVTGAIAQRLSTLTLSDMSGDVIGENQRAKYLDEFLKKLIDTKLQVIAEVTLGTGECLIKPVTDGKHFGIDIIENKDFRIINSIGDFVYSMLVKCDEKRVENDLFERYEVHELKEDTNGTPYCEIRQVCFKNGKPVDISSIDGWDNIIEIQTIPNVDRLLLGRCICPRTNRQNPNSPTGVPITYGNEEIVEEVKGSWRRFNQEFKNLEAMIFADKTVFKVKKSSSVGVNTKGIEETIELPKGKERVIKTVQGARAVDSQPLIKEFAPSIRDASLENGIEQNLKMLEIFCGLDCGLLSRNDAVYQNTDAIKKSIQNTFSFITRFRDQLDKCIEDTLYAINVICNANDITPMGDYEVNIDWSDEFAQSYAERFSELLQGTSLGVVSNAELRAWIMGEDLDLAKENIAEMEQENLAKQEMQIQMMQKTSIDDDLDEE